MLTVHDLVLKREGDLLHPGLSFALSPGQSVWVKGPNGVGKSSLLKALLGWLPHSGVTWHASLQKAYLGHNIGLIPHLTVWDYCATHPAVRFFDDAHCLSLLAELGLAGAQGRQVGVLSAGQQQRLALIPIMLSKAPVWLLDEPFTALDTSTIARLKSLFQRFLAEGVAMVIVSHHDLSDWASHTLCMEAT